MTAQLVISGELQHQMAEVIDRATGAGRPYIFSHEQLWDSAPERGDFHWHQQDGQMIGGGAELVLTPEAGADRFASIKAQARYWLEGAVGQIRFVGGFSFYDRPEAGIPRGLFFLPQWLWSSQTHTLTRHVVIYPHDRLEVVMHKLIHHSPPDTTAQGNARPPIFSIQELLGECSWAMAVEQAIGLMQQQKLSKIVLARVLEVVSQGVICPYAVVECLRANYDNCTVFLIKLTGVEDTYLVGASPELLLRSTFQDNFHQIKTSALAGSMPRSSVAEIDRALGEQLQRSAKNRQEHQMVINSICQSLTTAQVQIAPIPAPQLCQLANVQHLQTPICGRLASDDPLAFFHVLQELHPTAAMAGAPRDYALPLMRQYEPCDRGWYAAPVGWFDSQGNSEFMVAIRSGYITHDRARLFAGSGIIRDSEIEAEIRETNSKFTPLLQALGIPPMD
jgi:menaquinone-specific isochorismate synthase